MSMKEKMQRMNLTPLPMPKRSVPVQVPLSDESLPDDIKQVVREGRVDSIVYREKDCGVKASYTVTYKKADANSKYTTYDFFIVD